MKLDPDLRGRIAYREQGFLGDCGNGPGFPCRQCRDYIVADIIREAIADGDLDPTQPLPRDPDH